jgi:hypothetical protein
MSSGGGFLSFEVMGPEREVDHSSPCSVEFKNAWSHPVVLKQRDSYTSQYVIKRMFIINKK